MEQPGLLLPKGIVKNSAFVESDIQRIKNEPLEISDIARFWKVYTTTRRRLLDPTAERLENYWWRIWGSQRRELEAATVAHLFAKISGGESFVPLRGPSNRDEGNPSLITRTRGGASPSSSITSHPTNPPRPNTTSSSVTARPSISTQPPASILKNGSDKKTRGSSTTGPRPTARFISPHESQDEDSPVSPNSHVVVQPPSPVAPARKIEKNVSNQSITSASRKKTGFVASSKGKRPVVVRRQSSQSSTDSPARPGETHGFQSSSERTPPTFVDLAIAKSKQRGRPESQEKTLVGGEQVTTGQLSKKSRTSDAKLPSTRKYHGTARGLKEATTEIKKSSLSSDPGPSTEKFPASTGPRARVREMSGKESEANIRVQKPAPLSLPQTISGSEPKEGFQILHNSQRSRSDGSQDSKEALRHLTQENKSSVQLAPTLTDAAGQLSTGSRTNQSEASRKHDKGKQRASEDTPSTGMFVKRPVAQVTSTPIPDSAGSLSRSKSQLTLLLERDRAKGADDDLKDTRGKR